MMEQEHLIELKNVSKEFDGTTVLSDIDLYIRKKRVPHAAGPLRLRQNHHAADHRRLRIRPPGQRAV